MKTEKHINQNFIDKKLEIDHSINELIGNHLNDFDDNGLSVVKYIRKELKRVHNGLKACCKTGKLA